MSALFPLLSAQLPIIKINVSGPLSSRIISIHLPILLNEVASLVYEKITGQVKYNHSSTTALDV